MEKFLKHIMVCFVTLVFRVFILKSLENRTGNLIRFVQVFTELQISAYTLCIDFFLECSAWLTSKVVKIFETSRELLLDCSRIIEEIICSIYRVLRYFA